MEEEDSTKLNFVTVSLSSSVLDKLSIAEQANFVKNKFKRATNEIEHWTRVEQICDFFGVEHPNLSGDVYVRKFKNLTVEEKKKWHDLRDFNDDISVGFGVQVAWS